ncbi:TolC family protein [Sphingomonas sp. KC8]|uniref:TolC family protein n=1 Tax=Sphingomonas sp. KC8 TaxID=1030157 RepID=UPI000248B587|nr:TolC family protein [Sphingomonas sp. KC8]ARS26959.1 transporter [Sphingomonas sp. KC8]
MRYLFYAPLLVALPHIALAEPLSFDEAVDLAATQAPSLRARTLAIQSRQSAAIAAGELPDPKLGFGLDNFPISGPPAGSFSEDSMTMARVGIAQDVPNLAKRHARTGRAQADVAVAEAANLSEARRVRVATALAWIDLAYADRRMAAVDATITRLGALTSASTSSVASGSARPAQALDIRQAIASLEDRRSEVAAEVARARATLSRWTGDPDPAIEGGVPAFAIDPAALRRAIGAHPDLGAATARTRQAEADVTLARAEKRPDWGFDVAYQRRAERYGDMVSAGVTISLPLFAKKRQEPMIVASVATAGAALAEQEDMRRSLAADLEAGLADHVMHHEQWMRSKDTLLPLARHKADLETASYSAGRAGLLDVIQAQSTLADTELQTLDREGLVVRDAARLVLTYGGEDQ